MKGKKKITPPQAQVHMLLQDSQEEHRTHAFLTGAESTFPWDQPRPHTPALLGKEGFQCCQQATGPQAVGESDASVHGCRSQTKKLVHRVAQFLHTVNDFAMFLISKYGQTRAASDSRTDEQTLRWARPPNLFAFGQAAKCSPKLGEPFQSLTQWEDTYMASEITHTNPWHKSLPFFISFLFFCD